ncbi:hypothetical protein HAX54_021155, partial [Datura stramonium]|nr:hypothetical protein [Datura stramonium]
YYVHVMGRLEASRGFLFRVSIRAYVRVVTRMVQILGPSAMGKLLTLSSLSRALIYDFTTPELGGTTSMISKSGVLGSGLLKSDYFSQ